LIHIYKQKYDLGCGPVDALNATEHL